MGRLSHFSSVLLLLTAGIQRTDVSHDDDEEGVGGEVGGEASVGMCEEVSQCQGERRLTTEGNLELVPL